MATRFVYIIAACSLICIPVSVAFGCIYNVRDVGFTDVKPVPYQLYCYVKNDTPAEVASTFRQISYATFLDSNVEAKIVNVDQPNDPADTAYNEPMKYLNFWEIKSFPAAILVSPWGRSLVLPISVPDEPFKETMWSVLEGVVISAKRREILSSVIQVYGVVLFVEGKDADKNKRARGAVEDAIKQLAGIMSQMPKTIEKPPKMIVIPMKMRSQERVLLWSLGVDKDFQTHTEPYAATLYGRGRRIGPLLKGAEITTNAVFNILYVIGQSCECGIDREWLMGMMTPLRWNEKTQSETAKSLGFDPEDPMIKTEISQILFRSVPSGIASGIGESKSPLEGYSETIVEFEGGQVQSAVSPAQFRQLVSTEAATAGMDTGGASRPYRMMLLVVGGIAVLVLAGVMLVILRARRRVS